MNPQMLSAATVAIGLGAVVALALLPRRASVGTARGLELIRQSGAATPADEAAAPARPWLEGSLNALLKAARRFTPIGTPERLVRRVDLAGDSGLWTAEAVLAGKVVGAMIALLLGLAVWLRRPSPLTALFAVALVAGGYWLADALLYNAGIKRQEAIKRAAPDAMDMLTVCVEAGLGFDASLAKVVENSRGPLAVEFGRVLTELQLGRSRQEAFADLARRCEVPQITLFVAAVVQADRLGIPMAEVLREQASDLRLRRRQSAEEQAQKIPVKIVFPVLFCIFPAFFIIVIGPAGINIARVFGNG